MPTGTVKWFIALRSYGFITPEDGSADVFVHMTAVKQAGLQTLTQGQRIKFGIEPGRGGKSQAVNLTSID